MAGKVLSLLFALAVFMHAGAFTAHGEFTHDIIGDVIDFKLSEAGAEDIQGWIDGELSENAGVTSEWYVFALRNMGDYDFSAYGKALEGYLQSHTVKSAATRQKYALALIAAGHETEYISETAENSFGRQGIMSWVYGMHVLKNGYAAEGHTAESIAAEILGMQLPDGGWAVTGERGDVDVTAMTIQSLSYLDSAEVSAAVEAAVDFLSDSQLESGGFASYGVECSESAAQVIAALSSIGVDAQTDPRFIKNGRTVFDSLLTYQLEDGSFSHEIGGGYNHTATVQALLAAVAYQNAGGLYDFSAKEEIPAETSETVTETAENEVERSETETETAENEAERSENETAPAEIKKSYKPAACVIAIALGGAACIILYACKKRNVKNFLMIAVFTAAACAVIIFTDFRSAEDYYNADIAKENTVGTVTMSVTCGKIAGLEGAPADGIILPETTFAIADGDTAFDILVEACRKNGIHMEHSAGYVMGIGYVYEFDFGDLSGWMYHVNGETKSVGSSECVLTDGDRIEWLYSLEMGNDLN